jgi:putative ABC transport system permease protein
MNGVSLKGLWGRKLRTLLTVLAIVLGVSMISGTYVLTDTITAAFTKIVDHSFQNSDAVITGKVAFKNDNSNTAEVPAFPASVLAKVKQLPDVAAAAGSIEGAAKLIGRDGKVISTGGGGSIAASVDPRNDRDFNPLKLVSGGWPVGPRQIAIDQHTADTKHFAVGDTIGVAADQGVRRFEISGVAKYAESSSIGSATIAIFDVPTAQKLFAKQGKLDGIQVSAKQGVTADKLVGEIRPLLPATAKVKTAAAQTAQAVDDVNGSLGIFQKLLLAFAAIALFVGAFVIANTLSITIAQRVREFATLRTIGGSRRQVLRAVMLEALVVGAFASLIGLFAGFGIAKALNALFVAIGVEFPKGPTVFGARTIIVSLAVGIVVTLLASLRPAIRATRVPPIAAVREGAALPAPRLSRFGPTASIVTLALGILLLAYGIFGSGLTTAARLLALGLGTLILFVGVSLNAKRAVKPLAAVLGWPGARIGGTAGTLARENAIRNPSRTASTASALMVGLALITFVAFLGAGLRSSYSDAVNKLFVADYALTAENGFDPFAKQADRAVGSAAGVTAVSPIRGGDARVFGDNTQITAVEPNLAKTVRIDWLHGSAAVPAQLGHDGAFVAKDYAKDNHLKLGSPIALTTPTGKVLQLRLKGIFDPPKGGSPFGSVTMSAATFDANYSAPRDLMALINVKGGVNSANTAALDKALSAFPDAKIQTASQFKKTQEDDIKLVLNVLYALLGLSVLISIFGVVNTLILSVFERTRELGMLRAVGMTRRQVRRMVRYEGIVTSLIGGTLGVAVGLFLAVLTTQALSDQGLVLAIPWRTMGVFIVGTIGVGLLASVLPARRASRLNILKALQHE